MKIIIGGRIWGVKTNRFGNHLFRFNLTTILLERNHPLVVGSPHWFQQDLCQSFEGIE